MFYQKTTIAQMNREMECETMVTEWETRTMEITREQEWGIITTETETDREPEWEWAKDMVMDKRNQKEYASAKMMNPEHIISFYRYFNY